MAQHGGEASAVAPPRRRSRRRPARASPVAGPQRAAAGAAVEPCPASPATGRAESRRSRLGPAETIGGRRRRRRRAPALEALADARAAAGASHRCARIPSPWHKPHRQIGRPNWPRCRRSRDHGINSGKCLNDLVLLRRLGGGRRSRELGSPRVNPRITGRCPWSLQAIAHDNGAGETDLTVDGAD